jgi:hypothetical protein
MDFLLSRGLPSWVASEAGREAGAGCYTATGSYMAPTCLFDGSHLFSIHLLRKLGLGGSSCACARPGREISTTVYGDPFPLLSVVSLTTWVVGLGTRPISMDAATSQIGN